MKTIYLVKDLARSTGNSVYTIEHYLREGLLKEFGRGPHTGYRYFDHRTVKRIRKIRSLRKAGMNLNEIRGIVR